MDALSKIFDDIHLAQSEYLYISATQNAGFYYALESSMLAYIVLQGELQLKFSEQHIHHFKQGDLILLPSGIEHQILSLDYSLAACTKINPCFQQTAATHIQLGEALQPQAFYLLAIRAKLDIHMARPLLNGLPKLLHIQHIRGDTVPKWLQIGLEFLSNETQVKKPGQDKILDHLVSVLLIECVRDYILNLDDANNWLNALSHPELSNALAAIHGQPEQAWSVESLAETCCMSRSKFAQLFSEIVGEPPLAYLQQHRLRLAAQYLRDSQSSIQHIAHQVGYASETAFSQSFKKQFGYSPSQYRQISTQQI